MTETESSIPGISVGLTSVGTDEIERRFAFSRSTSDLASHQDLRNAAIEFAEYLDGFLTPGREKDIAIEMLETSVLWAHKAIAEEEENN